MKDIAKKGLDPVIYSAVFATKALVTSNVAQPAGVCDGSFGIIKEIVYELVELHKNRRDEELKKRLFHMNRRWSV